jgi:hypothetical protein
LIFGLGVLLWPGQAVLNGSMTFWVEGVEVALKKSGVKGVSEFLQKIIVLVSYISIYSFIYPFIHNTFFYFLFFSCYDY